MGERHPRPEQATPMGLPPRPIAMTIARGVGALPRVRARGRGRRSGSDPLSLTTSTPPTRPRPSRRSRVGRGTLLSRSLPRVCARVAPDQAPSPSRSRGRWVPSTDPASRARACAREEVVGVRDESPNRSATSVV